MRHGLLYLYKLQVYNAIRIVINRHNFVTLMYEVTTFGLGTEVYALSCEVGGLNRVPYLRQAACDFLRIILSGIGVRQ